jgi:undecaprenyl-diphosphatase
MLDCLRSVDQSLFFFLNGMHCPLFDTIMYWGTNTLTWFPLYVVLLYLMIRRYRWQVLWILLFAALMIIVSDQLANFFKDWIARPRPSHDSGLNPVHTVNGYLGGELGFYSGHASNSMAIAVFAIILLGRPFPYFALIMLFWALFMGYTRIYLGVHYPGDVLAGWISGTLLAWPFGQVCGWYIGRFSSSGKSKET